MSDFFSRLDKYLSFRGLNDNQVTVKAGLSNGTLGKQRKGSRGMASDSISKILYVCSDLNANWLLTGEGEMLKNDGGNGLNQQKNTRNNKDLEIIKLQEKHIATLEERIVELKEKIEDLEKLNKRLELATSTENNHFNDAHFGVAIPAVASTQTPQIKP